MKLQAKLLTLLTLVALAGGASAESIWDRRDQKFSEFMKDTRARQVGDLLTIVVQENTGIDQKDQRDMTKDTKSSGVFNFTGKLSAGNLTTRTGSTNVDSNATSSRQFDGKAGFTSDRRFADRMTVTVIEVMPNGNLVIEGIRRRIVTGEERTLRVTGVVRPDDIGVDNVVQSQFIARFEVTYKGKGSESKFTNQGWLSKTLNHVWPF